jgi:enoyl-CoA hydratase
MSTDLILVERTEHVATLTINRPDKLNALNADVLSQLGAAFTSLLTNDVPRAVILTGAGKAFVAGADIGAMAPLSPVQAKHFADIGHGLLHSIERAPFPVIAAVNGFALGGGLEIALACDFIIAADTAKLGQPEVGLGIIPGFGGTQRLTRRVGAARARELIYTGDVISAGEALIMGLVNTVYPLADLLPKVRDLATKIASRGPLAVASAKRLILHGETADLPTACELEATAFASLFGSDDQRGGMKAFLEKAKYSFTGK